MMRKDFLLLSGPFPFSLVVVVGYLSHLDLKTVQGEIKIQAENGETRVLRSAPDWTESAILGDHIWVSTSTSGSDLCYVGENKCTKIGPRLCCPACKVTAHTGCISILIDNMKFQCKPTFKDGVRQYREQTFVKHHWVHRRHEKGRCKHCGRSFQSKLSFGNKEVVAVSCSWCKSSYHNKEPCFTKNMLEDNCDFGLYRRIIVPSSWIVKLPRKGSFKSSIRRTPRNKRLSSKKRSSSKSSSTTTPTTSIATTTTPLSTNKLSSSSPIHSAQNNVINPLNSNVTNSNNSSANQNSNSNPNRIQRHRRHSHANVTSSSSILNGSQIPGQTNLLSGHHHHHPTNSIAVVNNRVEQYLQHVHRSFVIKPIPSANLRPLLVFINPKSGGNQGSKLIQKFQWHLNPRQVFDLSQSGPRLGLDLYKKVHNLRILACGGDGTAGWILSVIDEIAIQPPPPISVLPLGTGNDLARSFGWGGSYTDEPIAKILCNIQDGQIVQLDRWNLKVQPNQSCQQQQSQQLLDENKGAKHNLPLDVVNNYFSIGVDAHIALSFHEAREAHPERFNSRLRNKMFYGQAGGKDLLQRKWKDLCNYVHLECDGKDYTGRLKELKVHSVLFLNIPSYGGGTRPWPTSSAPSNFQTPKTDDGYIEVIGLTTYQLPLLQAGGHGTIIAQCRNANIITWRTIPMQVDGEPCRLLPSIINLELRNKANIVANTKTFEHKRQMPALEKITLKIPTVLGTITIDQIMELSNVRIRINEMMKEKGLRRPSSDLTAVAAAAVGNVTPITAMSTGQSSQLPTCFENESSPNETASTTNATSTTTATLTNNHSLSSCVKFVSNDWCFVDSVTAERFFRIDRAQEELYYDLFILDPQFDEKDDLDLFTSEEVIAKVVAGVTSTSSPLKSSSTTTTTTTAVSPMPPPPPSSLIMANGDDQQPISSSSLPIDHLIENFDNNHHYNRQNSQTLDLIPPTSLQTPPKSPLSDDNHHYNNNNNNNNDYLDNEPYYKQMRVNLMLIDEKGMSALHYAVLNNQDEAVSFLSNAFTQQMIDLCEPEFGHTALHKAIINNKNNICLSLILRGARLDIPDNNGQNCEQLGYNLGHHDLIKTLLHVSQACNRETSV
ncbi:hypothetical protein DERP_009851 [Dermatophagoides pteronyssinus]|uniref:Diacylglycerol kinase n=1 Tax=Dermatophagoides pteronyssinus TaxID=6956 RepID=A0ABQ8IRG0_DERPT|nr:hypothetical protein DERP_009851 [Dermatophagoides pteronyssinus]